MNRCGQHITTYAGVRTLTLSCHLVNRMPRACCEPHFVLLGSERMARGSTKRVCIHRPLPAVARGNRKSDRNDRPTVLKPLNVPHSGWHPKTMRNHSFPPRLPILAGVTRTFLCWHCQICSRSSPSIASRSLGRTPPTQRSIRLRSSSAVVCTRK